VRTLGGFTLALLFIVAFTPSVALLEERLAPLPAPRAGPADAVVVLGAGVSPDGVLGDHSLRRLVEGVALAHEGGGLVLVLQGPRMGSGVVEAEARAALARRLGLAEARLLVEPRGHTTFEEAKVARESLGPERRHILLVTGRYHMPRARRMFERAGFVVTPVPVEETTGRSPRPDARLQAARALLTEMIARAYNRMSGTL
jgi:uncharacterized SAM-binding protein YcdF (DUF218 family)